MEKQIKILLIDDEKDFAQPMAFWLKSKGYSVVVALDGKTSLDMLQEEKPDIIFLDLNMPVMDGIQTLKEIRESNKTIPVIIISAYADQRKLAEIEPYGFSGVFYKGEDFEKGLALLESVLRTHKKLQE